MWRIVRFLVRGVVVISLLVSLGVAMLWWRYRVDIRERWELAVRGGPMVKMIVTDPKLLLVSEWPWRGEAVARHSRPTNTYGDWLEHGGAIWITKWERRLPGFRAGGGTVDSLTVFLYPEAGPREPLNAPVKPLPTRYAFVEAPYWLVVLLGAIPSLLWGAVVWPDQWRARRRRRLGLCLSCGYDLRHSKERCPECGE